MKQTKSGSTARATLTAALCVLAACGGDDNLDGSGRGLDVEPDSVSVGSGQPGSQTGAGANLTVDDLECVHGGKVGKIEVVFECGQITTVSCKDLSNVVIELSDGTRRKFDGLSGQRGVFSAENTQAGQTVVRVWVKAGSNHSGDGPGYGERFDAPAQDCSKACVIVDGVCVPPTLPPSTDDCFIVDGVCVPPTPPVKPPSQDECFIVDGVCADAGVPPVTPPLGGAIGF